MSVDLSNDIAINRLQSPGNIMETVAATFQDYNGEFHHLKQKYVEK